MLMTRTVMIVAEQEKEEWVSVRELARRLDVAGPTISDAIDRAERQEAAVKVNRDPHTGKVTSIDAVSFTKWWYSRPRRRKCE